MLEDIYVITIEGEDVAAFYDWNDAAEALEDVVQDYCACSDVLIWDSTGAKPYEVDIYRFDQNSRRMGYYGVASIVEVSENDVDEDVLENIR